MAVGEFHRLLEAFSLPNCCWRTTESGRGTGLGCTCQRRARFCSQIGEMRARMFGRNPMTAPVLRRHMYFLRRESCDRARRITKKLPRKHDVYCLRDSHRLARRFHANNASDFPSHFSCCYLYARRSKATGRLSSAAIIFAVITTALRNRAGCKRIVATPTRRTTFFNCNRRKSRHAAEILGSS